MKESRFIELLNLYVDHQLSAPEAADLEAEIARDPGRHRTYQQYCRMQRACTLLFEQERSHAPTSQKLASAVLDADQKIVAFPKSSTHGRRGFFPIAMAAAAACVAIVFVRYQPNNSAPNSAPAVAVAPVPVSQQAAQLTAETVTPPAVAPAMPRAEYFSVFTTRRLSSERPIGPDDELTLDTDRANIASYAWMRDVELAPVVTLTSERITLDDSPASPLEGRVLRSGKPVHGTAEITAFQFQR